MSKWGIDYEFERDATLTIKSIKDRWIKAKNDLEDAKYLENLIHIDYLRSIKSYQTTWDYRLPTIKSAIDELKITDGRKKKPSLDCLNSWIKTEFFPDVNVEIKVKNITTYGYEGYTYQLSFDILGQEYAICVPNKKVINMDNLDHANEGKFAFLHKTSSCSTRIEFTDYKEEKMAEYIKNYFEEFDI